MIGILLNKKGDSKMGPYKDDLEAAHQRIIQLEKEKEEAENKQESWRKKPSLVKKFFSESRLLSISKLVFIIIVFSFPIYGLTNCKFKEENKDNVALTICKEKYPNGIRHYVIKYLACDYYYCRFYVKKGVEYKIEKGHTIFDWEVEEALNEKKAVEKE